MEASGRRLSARSERLTPYAFLLPLLAVFAAFYLWPALNTIASSLFEWGLLRPWRLTSPGEWTFVGIENYAELLSSDRFWNAVVNTAIWLVLFPVLVVATSLFVSVLIWNARAGGIVFRTAFVLPLTISLAAAGVMWSFVYNPDFGVLSAAVDALHLNFSLDWGPLRFETRDWLSDPGVLDLGIAEVRLANLSLVLAAFWAFTGFGVITFTAGLTAVSQDLVEAAIVDGARARHVVRHVLVPALRGPLIVVGVISVIFALRTFDIVWVMTRGGPATDTEVLAVLLWKQAFAFFDAPNAGDATAIAVILSAVLILGAYPVIRGLLRGAPR
ncbi:MAG: carbohydrate ABC transporter permease [Gaiellaceae bacterium]